MSLPLDLLYGLTMIIVGLCVSLLMFLCHRNSQVIDTRGLRKLPGPLRWPLIGSSLTLARYSKPWVAFSKLRTIYGDVFGMKLGNQNCVIVSSGDAIREVLVHKWGDFAHRPNFLRFSAIFRGDRDRSVALCDWSEKQRRRRAVTFPYTHPRVSSDDRLSRNIISELEHLVKDLSALDKPRDVNRLLLISCANIFYQFFCSCRFDPRDSKFAQIVSNYYSVFRQLFVGFPIDFFPWLRYMGGGRVLSHLHSLSSEISQFTKPLFEEHATSLDDENPRDLIDILLMCIKHPGDEETKMERLDEEDALVIIEDLIGGHVALHNMCMWALGLLVHRENIQNRIAAEANNVLGHREVLALSDRPHLPYTEATILEVLRMVVSPIIPHRATRDTSINDYFVEKDSLVIFNTYDLNLDPALWADPMEFNPQRFLSTDGRVIKPDYFIPFSSGKRTCLGDCISRSSLLLTLATILRLFHVRLAFDSKPLPPLHEIPGSFLWPEHVHLQFVPREEILLA